MSESELTKPSERKLRRALRRERQAAVKEGEVVKGKVLSIDDDHVQVDIGFKSEGLIDAWEFMDEDGNDPHRGRRRRRRAASKRPRTTTAASSSPRRRPTASRSGTRSATPTRTDEPVEGTIVARVKGGLSVDIGVKAFLPGSQVDLRPVRNLEQLLGEKLEFKIIKFNKRRGNIVLSRRALLETERKKMRETTLETLDEGQILDGVVKNITDYGAFIDLGGIDGLLHITDMSWGRVNHPSELFQVGDEIKVKVLKFDPETERVSLGLKQIQPDPWIDAGDALPGRHAHPGQGRLAHRLRRLRRARGGHRGPGPRLRDVLDQARQAPLEDGRRSATRSRPWCSTSTSATARSRSA